MTHPHRELDEAFATPVRLSVMAALAPDREITYAALRELLDTSESQLSKALSHLDARGYVKVVRIPSVGRARVVVTATRLGIAAFARHVDALRAITGSP